MLYPQSWTRSALFLPSKKSSNRERDRQPLGELTNNCENRQVRKGCSSHAGSLVPQLGEHSYFRLCANSHLKDLNSNATVDVSSSSSNVLLHDFTVLTSYKATGSSSSGDTSTGPLGVLSDDSIIFKTDALSVQAAHDTNENSPTVIAETVIDQSQEQDCTLSNIDAVCDQTDPAQSVTAPIASAQPIIQNLPSSCMIPVVREHSYSSRYQESSPTNGETFLITRPGIAEGGSSSFLCGTFPETASDDQSESGADRFLPDANSTLITIDAFPEETPLQTDLVEICATALEPRTEQLISLLKQKEEHLQQTRKEVDVLRSKVDKTTKMAEKFHKQCVTVRITNLAYRTKIKRLRKTNTDILSKVRGRLRADQLAALARTSTRGMKWFSATVKDGLQFKMKWGTKGYSNFVKKIPIYPSARSLQDAVKHIPFESGILHEVF